MRFHVSTLPHTITGLSEYSSCAYTGKVERFCKMMKSLGHEVFHYGAQSSIVDCTEHIDIISNYEQKQFFGEFGQKTFPIKWDANESYWQLTNVRTAIEINKRKKQKDFICLVGGGSQKQISDIVTEETTITVEPFIGYYGIFSRFRVFESYTHQASVYSQRSKDPDGCLYDAVIPNYYYPEDFPLVSQKKDYILYLGRLITRKGLQIVLDVSSRTGCRLILAGQGVVSNINGLLTTEEGKQIQLSDRIQYFGVANNVEKAKLMGEAHAVIMPTLFMEPFGGVAVEAQLCGTPVITTDYAAFSETILDGYSGYRCHTLKEFCDAIDNVDNLASPELIRQSAVVRYSCDIIKYKYEQYFERLLTLWGIGWHE